VDRLKRRKILGERTIVAPAVHVEARGINLLAETDTWVTHEPRSNKNNGIGVPDILAGHPLMRDRKILTLNEAKIASGTRELSPAVWDRFTVQFQIKTLKGGICNQNRYLSSRS
jgi:hypothetical protein